MKIDVEQLVKEFATYQQVDWSVNSRLQRLRMLRDLFATNERKILDALERDLHMSEGEGLLSEVSPVIRELDQLIANLTTWIKPRKIFTTQGVTTTLWQPNGVVTIISDRHHPVLLPLMAMVDAIAAGNRCIIVWPLALETLSTCLSDLIQRVFDYQHVQVLSLDEVRIKLLMKHTVGRLCYFGSQEQVTQLMHHYQLGLALMWLTPSKNPAIVTKTADLQLTAQQLMLGKLVNEGQSILGIDYVLVDQQVADQLKQHLQTAYQQLLKKRGRFGGQKLSGVRQLQWLESLTHGSEVVVGGTSDQVGLKMEFTVIIPDQPEHPSLRFPILGPVLPIVIYEDETILNNWLANHLSALVTYWFGRQAPVNLPPGTNQLVINQGYWMPQHGIRMESAKGYTSLGGKAGVLTFGHWSYVTKPWFSFNRQSAYEGRLIHNSYYEVKKTQKERKDDLR